MTGRNDQNANHTTHTGLKYLLIGGGLGAAAALLLTPKSGAAVRHDISDVTRRGYDGTLDLGRRLKERSTGLYQSLFDKVDGNTEGGDVLELTGSVRKGPKRVLPGSSNEDAALGSQEGAEPRSREHGRKASSII